jgi:tetratricopeptide (TPR) repeat protein
LPPLLRNKKYFDLRTNHPAGFRQIHSWLRNESPAPLPPKNPLPTRPPLFIAREAELVQLRQQLQPNKVVALSGMAGRGKTTLALEFAHRHQADFEAVYWLPCQSQSLIAIATDLQRQLGLKIDGDISQILAELKNVCGRKRCLLILDNVENDSLGDLIPGGDAAVLVTTRQPGLRFLRNHPRLPIDLFSEDQCFELFRAVLGENQVSTRAAECRKLFARIDRLPIAVSVLASLIQDDVRYTIASVAAKLPDDATALLKEAIHALDPIPSRLLSAMSVCAPEGFGLALAASLIDLDDAAALDALHHLASRSLVEEIDRDQRRYRLHALVREAAHGAEFSKRHAEAVYKRYEDWETDWRQCEQDMPDFQVALGWAMENSSQLAGPFADQMAFCGFSLNYRTGHPAEALEIDERMARAAEKRQDESWLQAWLGNQALILQDWGRLDEALALHKKKEALCLELGNKNSLQISYGNQALILQAWGRLDEALALHKKEEALCLELGNKDSLQISYGNQALILQAWGHLDEALALHKKEEALCLELGNKDGLSRSYGNQALILKAWGHLDEALALLKQQEALCLELGNKDGLQACYGNQALILKAWGRLDEALALLKQQEALCLELGNKDGLSRSYGNQALILKAWGRLDEALALHKQQEALCLELGNKDSLQISYGNQAVILRAWGRLDEALALLKQQEALCLELGNKDGLAYCYWTWGLLARAQNDPQTEHQKLTAALAIFTELRMPRERDSVADELAKTNSASA